jgi:beta-propeller uncharacterized protein DUF5122
MAGRLFHPFIGLFLGLAISAVNVSPVQAPGTLDPRFGNVGIGTTDITGNDDLSLDIEVQPDGRIIVVGTSSNPDGTDRDLGLARYNPDGSP